MSVYIGSIAVVNSKSKSLFHTPVVVNAEKDDQANAVALRIAREMYPL